MYNLRELSSYSLYTSPKSQVNIDRVQNIERKTFWMILDSISKLGKQMDTSIFSLSILIWPLVD